MASQVISGYQLLEVLGEGPRGIVYKARDPRSGGYVAIKIFHSAEPQPHDLKHPNVAAILGSGREGTRPYTVTEYLGGGSLKDRLRSLQAAGHVFSLDQIVAVAVQVGEGLTYAHRQGLAHGNLKAQNVIYAESGEAKLTDFASKDHVDFDAGVQSDLAAFGVLVYEMAAGKSPLSSGIVESIELVRPDLPKGFAQIISRMLDRGRHDRYVHISTAIRGLVSFSSSITATRVAAAPSTSGIPGLSSGRVLAGRFRIVNFIARGGMGDVYEAEDLELGERVALKTVRPEIAVAETAMERFKREIQLARKVTDPNVCRIFDIFHDGTGSERVTFLTMELLQGETLHQKVQREGRMSTSEALPIIRQMAAGLAAAHRAGVIHRDFKSSNVILVPAEDGREARAVVTDFGLARPVLKRESMLTLSASVEAVGTPAYMAPEQVEGGDITTVADIYTFGIVVYEMIAGTLPFVGDSALAVALKRLHGPPPSPRLYAPDLNDAWEAGILRCLERKPADRFQDIDQAVKAFSGEAIAASLPPVAPSRRIAAVGAAVLLAISLGAAGALLIRDNAVPSPEIRTRPAIAVLGFRNLTNDADSAWLSTALAEMLTTELAAGERLRAIPGENIARMKAEVPLPDSGMFAPDTLARIRSYLGADIVVHGSYVVINQGEAKIRLDLRLQHAVEGKDLATISQEGYSADLLALVSRTGAELRDRLGAPGLNPGEVSVAKAALPATPAAAKFYAEGLNRLRVFDALQARALFEKAVAEDKGYALAHAALANSWAMLGHTAKAKEQAKLALDVSTRLGREAQLLVEGRSHEAALEWVKAVQVYRTLFVFFPDNIEYGLRLAGAQTSAGQPTDAMSTIETLRKFPAPDGDSPRIDLAEALAAEKISEFERQQAMASRAASKAAADGAKLLVAGARNIEGHAFANLGKRSQAEAAFKDARERYSAAGDRWGAANVSSTFAYFLLTSGELDAAERMFQESLKTYREVGDQKGIGTALAGLAGVLRSRGNLQLAKKTYEDALAIYTDTGDRSREAVARNGLANVLIDMSDERAARTMWEAALSVFREIGDRKAIATVLSNLGDLAWKEEDFARARALHEESRDTFRTLGVPSSLAYELSSLGDLELINGDLGSARKHHQEALELRRRLGESGRIAESQLALAQIALDDRFYFVANTKSRLSSSGVRKSFR
jgi:serine/threonine protein kinase/tetratricopeptide (TPR) repeat protein